MNGPFVLDLTSSFNLLDMIHDRTGDAILSEIKEQVPQFNKEKVKYTTYAQSYWNNGVGKFPKIENFLPKSYSSSLDFEAADGDKMTPLGKYWTDKERRNEKLTVEVVPEKDQEEDEQQLNQLLELVRERFDFELKFHIISMIPTSTKLAFEKETSTKHQFDLYFSGIPRRYCKETVDSVFVTYHKYRLISRTFNTRMQEYLMSSKNGCDFLNIAAIFIRFHSPRTNTLEPEHNIDLFLEKYSYLLCFISSKKQYLSKKVVHFEENSIYKDFQSVFACIKSCWSELFKLTVDSETGSYALGGSIPYFRLNYYNNQVDDLNIGTEETTETKKEKLETEEEFKDETKNEEELVLATETKEEAEDEETTEADLVDEINQQTTNNNYMMANFSRLISTQADKKEKELKKIRTKQSEPTIEIETEQVSLQIVNENFEKIDPVDIGRTFFPNGVPKMGTEYVLATHTSAYSPIYSYEGYFCTLVRLALKQVLPGLFSEWYEETHQLFKSVTILNFQGYNALNNFLLHILLEDGKSIPKTVDASLVKGTCCGGQLEEITFVNFVFDNFTYIFSNDRSYYPSAGKFDTVSKDPMSIKSHFFFDELPGYDSASKKLLKSCFANKVKKASLVSYGDYIYSLGSETGVLISNFPNLKEVNILAKTRENVEASAQINTVFTTTISDIESSRDSFKKFYEKFYLLFEGKPQKVIDANDSSAGTPWTTPAAGDDQEEGASPELTSVLSPLTRPMFDKQDEQRLVLRVMITAQVNKDNIEHVVKLSNQRLECMTLINSLICQSPGLSILKKKEIIDYCIKTKQIPYAAIDTSNYEHSEEKRILEEYLIYHNNKSEELLLIPDSIIYDPGFYWCNVLLYFGLNIFKNPQVLEEFFFSMMVGRGSKLNGYYFEKTLLLDLYIAKLFYENGSSELLVQGLSLISDFQNMENLEEIIRKVESDSNCTEEISSDKTVRALQIFFRHFTRPKTHPDFEKQKVQLNINKVVAMLTSIYDDMRLVDNILTLASCLDILPQVLNSTSYMQSTKYNVDAYGVTDGNKSYITFMDPSEETVFNRQVMLTQMTYEGQISENEAVVAHELDTHFSMSEAPKLIKTNMLNLLCSSLVRANPLLLSLVENMSPDDLLFRDGNGNTCLTILLSQRPAPSVEVITAILDKQPKLIHIPTFRLMTPLHICCMDPSNISTAKLLVTKYGASTDVISAYGLTPYETAAILYLNNLFPSKSVLRGFLNKNYGGMSWLEPKGKLNKREILKQMMMNK